MTREQLEHAIRSACAIAEEDEVWVIGSQAILGQFPDAPDELRRSVEVDLCPVRHPDRAEVIEGAMGELSPFHALHGFYVQGVSLTTAILPHGWQKRVIRVVDRMTGAKTGLCLEVHDLAASKLAAFRDKDRDFVRILIMGGFVRPRTLITRLRRLPVDLALQVRLSQWVHVTVYEARPQIQG